MVDCQDAFAWEISKLHWQVGIRAENKIDFSIIYLFSAYCFPKEIQLQNAT